MKNKIIKDLPIPEGAVKAEMPDMVKPMLATLIDKPFNSDKWLFELKWDGYRALANINNGNVKLYSRNGLTFTQYEPVVKELETFQYTAIMDGEVVVLNEEGFPKFQLLQNYEREQEGALQYNVFDLLYYNGYNLTRAPLIERKELLSKLIKPGGFVKYTDHVIEQGIDFFKEVDKLGMEGIIGKKMDSPYRLNKRTSEWVKIKTEKRQEAIICGYTEPKGSRQYFGSLVLGVYDDDNKLKWIGSSGGGFDEKGLEYLFNKFQKIRIEKSPFDYKISQKSKVYWVKPELVCEVSFSEWTTDGSMRHPVYQGLRSDKNPKDVKREKEAKTMKTIEQAEEITSTKKSNESKTTSKDPKSQSLTIGGHNLQITNLSKILWPDDGITKGDLINYYRSISKFILPHLKNRPESLNRYPNGIKEQSFYQKNNENAPEWVDTIKIRSDSKREEVNYLICNNEATLVYMAKLACIEIHPWNSRVGSLDNPDWIVMDIDPSELNTFEQVIDTAQVIKSILDKGKIDAYIKTSGATGLHIYIPMGSKYTYEEGRSFAHVIAQLTTSQIPEITTIERSLKNRDGKIYVDYLQNSEGQTLASAYSVRPKPGASVSMPLKWDEINHGFHPSDFNIKNALKRVEKNGDIFKPVLGKGIDMQKCLKLLSA